MTLNFHPILLENARAYARRHDMKLNAVFKKGFELLQDQESSRNAPAKPGAGVPVPGWDSEEEEAPY